MAIGAASQTVQAQGKSREQVNRELTQAQHNGTIPVSKTQYPPDDNTIARNKELHAISRHAGEKAPPEDMHDSTAAR
jgi:hypothetical protein